jgi:hypothetical protein
MKRFMVLAITMLVGPVVAMAGIVVGDRALYELRDTDVDHRLEFTLGEEQLEALEEYFQMFDERETIEEGEAAVQGDAYTVDYGREHGGTVVLSFYDPESPPEVDAEEEFRWGEMYERVEETLDGFPAEIIVLEHTGDEGEDTWYVVVEISGYLVDGTDMGCQSAAEIFFRICSIPGMELEVQSEEGWVPTTKNPMRLPWARVLTRGVRLTTMDILDKNVI